MGKEALLTSKQQVKIEFTSLIQRSGMTSRTIATTRNHQQRTLSFKPLFRTISLETRLRTCFLLTKRSL